MSMYDSTVDCMAHNFHINISELLRGNKNLNYKKSAERKLYISRRFWHLVARHVPHSSSSCPFEHIATGKTGLFSVLLPPLSWAQIPYQHLVLYTNSLAISWNTQGLSRAVMGLLYLSYWPFSRSSISFRCVQHSVTQGDA